MFTFIWAVGQASAVESLKTQNSNMYLELEVKAAGVPTSGHTVDRLVRTPAAFT